MYNEKNLDYLNASMNGQCHCRIGGKLSTTNLPTPNPQYVSDHDTPCPMCSLSVLETVEHALLRCTRREAHEDEKCSGS